MEHLTGNTGVPDFKGGPLESRQGNRFDADHKYRSRDKHHRDSGFCGISRGSLRDITRETAGYPAGVCGISRGRLRDIPRYSFGRPVVSRVPRSEKTWCETPKSTAARNGDGGVRNVYFYVLPGDLCRADGV
ncbi:hypothetical protein Bbelb_203960 [Branchiostoma belcheri]|nr:hypothetical protein Bbelb_203960 [Branchiostoma belcheri]